MHITVLTPDKEIFSGNITSVKVPGTNGEFQVLKNHAPIVASLDKGKVEIVTSAGEHRVLDVETGAVSTRDEAGRTIRLQVKGGFIEVLKNEISLLVTGASNGL